MLFLFPYHKYSSMLTKNMLFLFLYYRYSSMLGSSWSTPLTNSKLHPNWRGKTPWCCIMFLLICGSLYLLSLLTFIISIIQFWSDKNTLCNAWGGISSNAFLATLISPSKVMGPSLCYNDCITTKKPRSKIFMSGLFGG